MKKILFICLIWYLPILSEEKKLFDFRFTGFLRNDAYFVTNAGYKPAADNQTYVAPLPPVVDQEKNTNVFAHLESSAANIIPGLALAFRSNYFDNMSIDGYVDGLFYNYLFANTACILKNAFIQIVSGNDSVLIGQTSHPMVPAEINPNTIVLSYGSTMAPNNRNPQLRYRHTWNERINGTFALSGAYQFGIDGPLQFPFSYSTEYIRNAVIPMMTARLEYRTPSWEIGIGANAMRYVPRLATRVGQRLTPLQYPSVAHEHVWSSQGIVYGAYWHPRITVQGTAMYGANGNMFYQLGGYGVATHNPINGARTYANIYYTAEWIDINLLGFDSPFQPGLFIGFTKNLGSRKALYISPITQEPIIYSLENYLINAETFSLEDLITQEINPDFPFQSYIKERIMSLWRIAPRIWYYPAEYIAVGFELTIFSSTYGLPDRYAKTDKPNRLQALQGAVTTQFLF